MSELLPEEVSQDENEEEKIPRFLKSLAMENLNYDNDLIFDGKLWLRLLFMQAQAN